MTLRCNIRFPEKFAEYWSKYSLDSIFKELGPPDTLFFIISQLSGGYVQFTVYSKLGILIQTNGYRYGNMICPTPTKNSGEHGDDIGLELTNLDYPLDIYYGLAISPTDKTSFVPVQESLGMTSKQYSQKVIANPTGCFNVLKMSQ